MTTDLLLTTDEWTEITGLEEGSSYNIQCIEETFGKPVEFFFTQASSAPESRRKGTYAYMGVAFKKGDNKTFVCCKPNVNVHVEDIL